MSKNNFKHLRQEFENNVSNLVKRKRFYPYGYMNNFEKLKEELSSIEKLFSSLTSKIINEKEYEHILHVWNKFDLKTIKDYYDFIFS